MKRTTTATESEIQAIPAVPFTQTWRPVHHAQVIHTLHEVVGETGIGIRSTDYEVSKDGMNLFARWHLDVPVLDGRANMMCGFRNSMAKKFALAICSGNNVTVCSNMVFTGDFIENRRHTSGLTTEMLYVFLSGAFAALKTHTDLFSRFFEMLGNVPVPENNYKVLTYNAMEQGIIAPSKFNRFMECRQEEKKDNPHTATETLQHFHGAVTRLLRETSVEQLQVRSGKLNRMLGWEELKNEAELIEA